MNRAFIGLGANIGDAGRQIRLAIDELKQLPDTHLVLSSGMYRSAPLGYADQPDFLNAVACVDTGLSAARLLELLQEIEQRQGRERPFANAPRTLDLDLLLYGEEIRTTPELMLPHPRMHERAFVLKPLLEIAPHAILPERGAAAVWLARLENQFVEKMT